MCQFRKWPNLHVYDGVQRAGGGNAVADAALVDQPALAAEAGRIQRPRRAAPAMSHHDQSTNQ